MQVVYACIGILQGNHDRSRLPAAQLLLTMSTQPALVPKLEPVLPMLLQLLVGSGRVQLESIQSCSLQHIRQAKYQSIIICYSFVAAYAVAAAGRIR